VLCFLAACAVALVPSSDYKYLVASGVDQDWQILKNGAEWRSGSAVQSLLVRSVDGRQQYTREGNLDLEEGSVEMRVALREDGSSELYRQSRTLLSYTSAGGDNFTITQAGAAGIVYFGGTVQGQWQSAYGGRGLMRGWLAGEKHHLMATWSVKQNRMRFFVDGVLAADTNEGHYRAAAPSRSTFTLDATAYEITDVVLWRKPLDLEEVRAHAQREDSPRAGELWLPVAELQEGDGLLFSSGGCTADALLWQGVPVRDADPASTLLPPGTTEIDLTVQTPAPAECRYSVNEKLAFDAMLPLDGRVTGLAANPNRADQVWVRCSNAPEYALRLLYRSLPEANPSYPRKSNLWGSSNMLAHGLEFASKVDLYLGAEMSASDIRALRERNPRMLVLTSINTVENHGLPEDYFLHDTQGNKIEVWPGTYRLNLTKPYVAEYQARWAYQKMLDADLMYDGCFFDNFFTSQSWLKADIHGRAVQLDADEDGKPDDPAWLDRAWRQGVFYELSIWRRLMPHALATGHLPNPVTPEVGEIFNGNSILFWSTNVLDGKTPFAEFDSVYRGWMEQGRAPALNTIEASPQNQIAYGYGYDINKSMPAATQQFARDFYRYLRFPLAFTLMSDGYFHRDMGDIQHGNDWWYDEYDFDLGYPEGPAEQVVLQATEAAPLLQDGSFEQELGPNWVLYVDTARSSAQARVARDTDAVDGAYSVRIDIVATAADWQVDFHQRNRSLEKGKSYDLSFWAKADAARSIGLASQKGSADWRGYGLSRRVDIGTDWKQYRVTFEALETVNDSRIQFFTGDRSGSVWLDGVDLRESPAPVYRRLFTKGAVLLNASRQSVTIPMPPGYERFQGSQAPRYQNVIDEEDDIFRAEGDWRKAQFDSGQWKSTGPYYHHWGTQCQVLQGSGQAEYELGIPEDGTYTIEAWWAAAPEQSQWTRQAVYEIVAGGQVVATSTLDQTLAGDQWRPVGTVYLRASDKPVLRMRNAAPGALVADGVYVWSEARLNDGTPAPEVTLAPMDGILLRRP